MRAEEQGIISLIHSLRRKSPLQKNAVFDTDAEILQVGENLLALTTDSIVEEFELGLLQTPEAQGWLAVICSLSDLAAVGAMPLGMLMSAHLPYQCDDRLKRLMLSIEECLRVHETYLLGGDTNEAKRLSLTSTALGMINGGRFLNRSSYQVGDLLYYYGEIGIGNMVALANMTQNPMANELEQTYRPVLNFQFLNNIYSLMSSCIDTSDGLFSTASVLASFKKGGIHFHKEKLSFPRRLDLLSRETGIDPIAFCIGEVGDYGLLFTVHPEYADQLDMMIESNAAPCFHVGEVKSGEGLFLDSRKTSIAIPMESLKADLKGLDPRAYLKKVLQIVSQF